MTTRTLRSCTPLFAAALTAALAACASTPSQPTGPAPVVVQTPPPAADGSSPAATAPKITKPGPNVTPEGVVFNHKAESKIGQIFLAGSFNEWNPSNNDYLMKDPDGDGIYSITVKLAPGTYQYKYVIDSKWTQDTHAPSEASDGYGAMNSKFDVK